MIEAIIGGAFIGAAAVWLLASTGRIAGISGIVATAVKAPVRNHWSVLFILGLGAGGWLGVLAVDHEIVREAGAVTPLLLVGGLLVGVGTRLGSGCTSGHGVCGIARFSKRSIVATLVFVGVGVITATGVYG